jgi:hypothetical protein
MTVDQTQGSSREGHLLATHYSYLQMTTQLITMVHSLLHCSCPVPCWLCHSMHAAYIMGTLLLLPCLYKYFSVMQ